MIQAKGTCRGCGYMHCVCGPMVSRRAILASPLMALVPTPAPPPKFYKLPLRELSMGARSNGPIPSSVYEYFEISYVTNPMPPMTIRYLCTKNKTTP